MGSGEPCGWPRARGSHRRDDLGRVGGVAVEDEVSRALAETTACALLDLRAVVTQAGETESLVFRLMPGRRSRRARGESQGASPARPR
jgi:hypothetical protein